MLIDRKKSFNKKAYDYYNPMGMDIVKNWGVNYKGWEIIKDKEDYNVDIIFRDENGILIPIEFEMKNHEFTCAKDWGHPDIHFIEDKERLLKTVPFFHYVLISTVTNFAVMATSGSIYKRKRRRSLVACKTEHSGWISMRMVHFPPEEALYFQIKNFQNELANTG